MTGIIIRRFIGALVLVVGLRILSDEIGLLGSIGVILVVFGVIIMILGIKPLILTPSKELKNRESKP